MNFINIYIANSLINCHTFFSNLQLTVFLTVVCRLSPAEADVLHQVYASAFVDGQEKGVRRVSSYYNACTNVSHIIAIALRSNNWTY